MKFTEVLSSYLSSGEDRKRNLKQALDLNLHGCQGPLEDGQWLQNRDKTCSKHINADVFPNLSHVMP